MSVDPAASGIGPLESARALHEAGRDAEAEAVLLGVCASGGGRPVAWILLADIERALDRPSKEARALEQALAATGVLDDNVRLWTRLAAVRARLGDCAGAAAAWRRVMDLDPRLPGPRENLARMQLAQQDLVGARLSVEELERRFPDAAITHLLAGHVQKAQGDTAAARERYALALELEPTLGEALYSLVDITAFEPAEETAVHAADLALRDDLSVADRVNASFAYARILDRAGRYHDAFEYLRRANDLARDECARQRTGYVAPRVEARVARAINDYPARSFGSAVDSLAVDLTPIFIVGLPRSGTTLIEQILASHGDVQTGGELVVAHECEQRFRRQRKEAGREGPIDTADAVDRKLLAAARERYVDALLERDLVGPWVVDKLPANFEIAGFLRLMFPAAAIIHAVRDPRATCFSLYAANFSAHESWYHDLWDLAHYFGQYKRLMEHWRSVVPAPFIEVAYEDLVRCPHARISALLEAIGLPFDPACIEFHRHERAIFTASHAQVRRPMYVTAIDHWRNYSEWLGELLIPARTA